ncbi:hypothetical protein ASPZODRAFT_75012 [Penicilliopsis zonata CBS 506.65]|uniref:Ribosomal RNA-processing protein 43 n=1 Tax=Penicilliopsis zonata CBS 506.65 TaxID=1073090 RepID=A0A1L9S7I8_9EURO|nr:hypothetical protein ASPZODRAFT_75012 [Penicilliopsis zonata CBS 506.65]OJJ43130.1 hypothetical protein ASPZODRAFT_75012 [Penicilliopsis zonata CBS 506.65]
MVPSAATPSLSLPPAQFASLQPHAYLLAHLSPPALSNQPSIRANGRSPSQFRATSANAGSLTHANGSAVVRLGDTAAVCGVRAEILHTDDIASWSVSSSTGAGNKRRKLSGEDPEDPEESQIQDLNLLVPNLSLSTGCAPGFIPGAPPSALAQSLSHQLLTLLHTSRLVRTDDLRIWYDVPDLEGAGQETGEAMDVDVVDKESSLKQPRKREIKAFWVLYIDVMIVSLAGNVLDAAWAAVLAALRDTKLPRAWWDVDAESVLCSNRVDEARSLLLRGLPVCSSFCVFEADAAAGWRAVVLPTSIEMEQNKQQQRWILADPDGYEEGLTQERMCIVLDKDQSGNPVIVRMEKNGGWTVGKEDLRQLVDVSAQRWEEMKTVLKW